MVEKIVIDDFIVLGRAAPDMISYKRKSLCVAGYSHKKGFMRIYPTSIFAPFHAWKLLSIPLERNPKDVRHESWKIQGSRKEWTKLHEKVEEKYYITSRGNKKPKKYKKGRTLMYRLKDPCTSIFNNPPQRSLGVVKPIHIEGFFKDRDQVKEPAEKSLLEYFDIIVKDHWLHTKDKFDKIPYLRYECEKCKIKGKYHEQQLLSIEAYEWMRKNPHNIDQLWENYHINDPEYDVYLFVGNQNKYKTSFMVINILRFKKSVHKLHRTMPLVPLKKYDI